MPIADPKSVFDTSKMSPAQREALELTEAARESAERGFAGNLGLSPGSRLYKTHLYFDT
jgi:hypothetical protein